MYKKILVRFGELSTKGKNKMTFVRQLEKNIKNLINIDSEVQFDRIFLPYSQENIDNLQTIFGIQSYSPVALSKTNIEDIEKIALDLIKTTNGKTFKVVTKRHWKKFGMSSSEMNGHIGGHVLSNTDFTVDVKTPDVKLEIEIREESTYIFVERVAGLGGYPVGINGKVLHLISGGIDSPVAAFELMKRGLHVDYLSFTTPPHTDAKTIEKVNKIISFLNKYQGNSRLFRSNYTNLMQLISMTSNQSYKICLMRRSFYRIAANVAKKHGYLAVGNGENIGQVASQTLESIHVIQSVCDLPIFRPVLTADKIETINKGIKIGTYQISIEKASETCELFAPRNPVTKPTIHKSEELELELSELVSFEKENIDNIESENIKLNKERINDV